MLIRIGDTACHLSGIPGRSLSESDDLGIIDPSAVHLHQGAGIYVCDPVSQCRKVAVCVHIGHGTDALGIVPNPDSQLIGAVLLLHRFDLQSDLFLISSHGQCLKLSTAFRDPVCQVTFFRDRFPVQCYDIVS